MVLDELSHEDEVCMESDDILRSQRCFILSSGRCERDDVGVMLRKQWKKERWSAGGGPIEQNGITYESVLCSTISSQCRDSAWPGARWREWTELC